MTEENNPEQNNCTIDYENRCDCRDDDNCGCSFPNNMDMDFQCNCTEENHCGCLDGDPCLCNEDDDDDDETVHCETLVCHRLLCDSIECNEINFDNMDSTNYGGIDCEDEPCFCSLVREGAPDFTAPAIMPDNRVENDFNLSEYIEDSYALLFFYPMDFSFVCPSELIALNNRINDFKERGVKVVSISVDSIYAHLTWKKMKPEDGGIGDIQFPMVSDITKEISYDYGVLTEDGIPLRASFIIDPDGIVRHQLVNDLAIGRSVDETLRNIDALIQHSKNGNVCPANWQKGDEGMVSSFDAVREFLKKNAHKL